MITFPRNPHSRRLFKGDDAIAGYIKSRVREETGLPCTITIASNKLVAKIACDEVKPDGYVRIEPGREKGFLRPLALDKLPGVGPHTREILASLGVRTIGDAADLPLSALLHIFGSTGYALQRAAWGISSAPVKPESIPKLISRETTFEKDLVDWDRIEHILIYLAERALYTLRRRGMEGRCVTLKIRYADFKTRVFSKTLPEPTCVDHDVIHALYDLLPKAKVCRSRVRLVGVALSLLNFNQHQMHLFGKETSEKWEQAMESVDRIRNRYGFEFVGLARSIAPGRKVRLATPSLSE